MVATRQIREIIVRADTRGSKELRQLSKEMGTLNKSTLQTARSARLFSGALVGFLSIQTLRSLSNAADSFQLINDRIKVFTSSTEEASRTFDRLIEGAKFAKTDFDTLGNVYSRIIVATKEIGLTSEQAAAAATALQQTFRVGGATAREAAAASIQLAQGLGAGALRGEEFRSIAEQNTVLLQALAKELGKNTGELRDLAAEGKITSDVVFSALANSFQSVSKQASGLGQTIQQSLIIAMDGLKIKTGEIAREFDVNGKVAKGVDFLIENFDTLLSSISGLIASGVIIKLTTQIKGLGAAVSGGAIGGLAKFALANPFTTAAGAIVGATIALRGFKNEITDVSKVDASIKAVNDQIERTELKVKSLRETAKPEGPGALETVGGVLGAVLFGKKFEENKKTLPAELLNAQRNLDGLKNKLKELQSQRTKLTGGAASTQSVLDSISLDEFDKANKKITEQQRVFSKLNNEYKNGLITLKEYSNEIDAFKLDEVNKKFNEGKITLEQYNKQLESLPSQFTMSEQAARSAGNAFIAYAKDAQNFGKGISGAITNLLGNLEDALVKFVRNGKLSFKDLTNAILDDLAKIAVRASVTAPLANAFGSLFSGPSSSGVGNAGTTGSAVQAGNQFQFANGGVFSGGKLQKLATGGVVSSPTIFPMANGAGLMGEDGPEAIMPLTRRNGKLGVEGGGSNVQINIINQTDSNIEQEETTGPNGEQQLNLLITSTVKDGFSSGKFDRSLSENFNVNRKGR